MKKQNILSAVVTLVLIMIGALVFFPIFMAIVNSFKTQSDIFKSVLALPKHLNFDNYMQAFEKMDFIRTTGNTLYITVLSVVGIIIVGAMAGYRLSRTPGKLSGFLFILFTSSMLVPFQSIMIPLAKLTKTMGIQGSKTGLVITYIGLGINMAIFLYHGFVKSLPKELEEAALIDGCNDFQVFYKIVFPLLAPITSTIAILDVLWIWNDFLLPLVMITNSKNYTLVLATNMFFGKYSVEWPNVLSGLVATWIPVVIFYAIFQKNIVKGIVSGAVKG